MKKFQIGRYLKNFAGMIVLLSVLAGIMFYTFAQKRQSYHAAAVISYTNEDAQDGLAPDGSKIDTTEINSSKVVSMAFDKLGLSYEDYNVGDIRSRIQVRPIISNEKVLIQESLNEEGKEYTKEPTEYLVTFWSKNTEGKNFAREMLGTILEQYTLYYSENHVGWPFAVNDISDIYEKNFDYIEMMEEIDRTIISTMDTLSARAAGNERFRAASTGYSFSDLYGRFELIQKNKVSDIFAEILDKKITKDKDILLSKYKNRISSYGLENIKNESESDEIWNIIESYVKMMRESENTSITYEYILDEVYDEYIQTAKSAEEDSNPPQKADRRVEYDILMEDYVKDRTSFEHAVIDTAYCKYISSIFAEKRTPSSEADQNAIQKRIEDVVVQLNELYRELGETDTEYNNYLGAANIAMLSSISVEESINIKLYLLIAVLAVAVMCCAAAVLFGRVGDILGYYLHTDHRSGVPNRSMCDKYIQSKEKNILPVDYFCVVIKMSNLWRLNEEYGRAEGDKALKIFANIIQNVFIQNQDDFMAHNGSGIFMIFGTGLDSTALKQKIEFFHMALNERNVEVKENMLYQYGSAVSGEDKIYNIRKLSSRAFATMSRKVFGKRENADEQ